MTTNDPSATYRARLVEQIARRSEPWPGERWDPRVLEAMRTVPRHAFVPGVSFSLAYDDMPQPIGNGQTISQPTVVAMMTQALALDRNAKLLEIGTGSGYHAAVVSMLAKEVYTIEIHESLATNARETLESLGYRNVHVRHGDGYAGWPEHAPFDRILLTAAPPTLPDTLVEQLAEGGILVAPVGPAGGLQQLVRYRKHGGKLAEEDLGAVMFVPMVRGE
ncbi:MAG: protein-L-isoaspartate(D-aspartate) O-methyltransferase [Polyangiaceae bacterium]|nr:protein-L-isoaspartate(D-aspartate) O-methyltransferase [Polyangiaceae bacterium]